MFCFIKCKAAASVAVLHVFFTFFLCGFVVIKLPLPPVFEKRKPEHPENPSNQLKDTTNSIHNAMPSLEIESEMPEVRGDCTTTNHTCNNAPWFTFIRIIKKQKTPTHDFKACFHLTALKLHIPLTGRRAKQEHWRLKTRIYESKFKEIETSGCKLIPHGLDQNIIRTLL